MENSAYRSNSEQELTLVGRGDTEAFGELARRYRPMAFRTALSILRNEFDAEEQVQNALCKAWEHIGQFRRSAKFSTWLVRIVVNECLMHLRRMQRTPAVSMDEAFGSDGLPLEFASESESPEKAAERLWFARLLEREIRSIPPLLRNTFLLRDVQQIPMADVARSLGISVGAAKARLWRARYELRKRLEPHLSMRCRYPNPKTSKNARKETSI